MLFRSRQKRSIFSHARQLLWPRKGFARVVSYLRYRVVRLPDTPHRIAAGVASGVAASLTPLIGFHFLLAALLAWIVRGNIIGSAIGTAVGNPWTFPFIWLATYEVGTRVLGMNAMAHPFAGLSWQLFVENPLAVFGPVVGPMMLGSVPLALLAWWLTYWPLKRLIGYYRERRAEKLAARHASKDGAPKDGAQGVA